MKIFIAIAAVLSGFSSVIWGIGLLVAEDFMWGAKFTSNGRDGRTVLLAIVIGAAAILWGGFEIGAANDGDD